MKNGASEHLVMLGLAVLPYNVTGLRSKSVNYRFLLFGFGESGEGFALPVVLTAQIGVQNRDF